MKNTLFVFTLMIAFMACKNEPKAPTIVADPNMNEPSRTKIFSELPFDFVCVTKIDSSSTNPITLKTVHIISADLKDPGFVIEIKTCEEISKEDYSQFNIPEGTDAAVKGLTVKDQDIIMAVKTEEPGIAIVTRALKEGDEFKFGPYKKYTLNDHGYKMEAQTVITSNN